MPVEELQRLTNKQNHPWTEACAVKGKGVFETLKLIGKTVIDELNRKYSRPGQGMPAAAPAPQTSFAPSQPRPYYPQPSSVYSPPSATQQQPMRIAPASSTARSASAPFAQQPAPQRHSPPAPAGTASPFSSGADPFAAASAPMIQQTPVFTPPKPEAAQPKAASSPSGDYTNYNSVNLEPMANASSAAGFGRPLAQPQQSGPGQEKSELDIEIEKYQREIEERQHGQSSVVHGEMQAPAAHVPQAQQQSQQPIQQAPFSSSRPTQYFDVQPQSGMAAPYAQPQQQPQYGQPQTYAPQQPQPQFGSFTQPQQQYRTFEPPRQQQQLPPQQTQAPQYGQSQNYGPQQPAFRQPQANPQMYQPAPTPAGGIPHQQSEAQMPAPQTAPDSDTPLFFTSVDTDKTRKPRKVLNPKDKAGKGFFSKLLGKKEADE
jgi:hypothetical protein